MKPTIFPLTIFFLLGGCRDDETTPPITADNCRAATPDNQITLPIAASSARVDLGTPVFSNPTNVTNPLFPISDLEHAVLLGFEDSEPFRAETTLLSETKRIAWAGQEFDVLVSQYLATVDRRIAEVALDFYAQADGGAVWYLGEDVMNYEDGAVVDTEGTWRACTDGPGAMIMPAEPHVGDVYRPENVFGVVFEEVTVKTVGQTVEGPRGPIMGAITVEELHQDATREEKIFAPGYGEFATGNGADVEGLAIAFPIDALETEEPAALGIMAEGSLELLELAQRGDWPALTARTDEIEGAWIDLMAENVPPRVSDAMQDALDGLDEAIADQDPEEVSLRAIDVRMSSLDLMLQYRPLEEIDRMRLHAWARMVLVDVEVEEAAGVASDVAILEWIAKRTTRDTQIDAAIQQIRTAADRGELESAREAADRLIDLLADPIPV
jgi:hypothetical protein